MAEDTKLSKWLTIVDKFNQYNTDKLKEFLFKAYNLEAGNPWYNRSSLKIIDVGTDLDIEIHTISDAIIHILFPKDNESYCEYTVQHGDDYSKTVSCGDSTFAIKYFKQLLGDII